MATLSFRVSADYQEVQRLREEIAKLKQEIKGTDAIQSPHAFNTLNAKLVQTSQELGKVEGKIISASAKMETDFKQKIYAASQGVNDFTEKIIAQKAVVKDVAADVKRLGEAYRDAKKYSPMSADGKLAEWKAAKRALEEEKAALFGLTQEQATARLSVKRLNDEYKAFRQEGGGTAQTMDLLSSKMKGIAASVMGGMGLKELASRIISVRAEFESMETSLKVLLGGSQERLNNIMGQIKEYALASPLNTKDMVGAVQMMTSFGIEAEKSIDYLKAIGDISMGDTGKFNSLALSFSQMSSAGKLMGQDLLQMVNAGFNPLEEISRKTGKSIGELKEEMSKGAISAKMVQDAFISVTSAGGKFYGMSAEGAKTLNGQISMLQESFDNMFNEIGSKGEGVVMGAVQAGTSLIENYQNIGKILEGLVVTYGIYKTALVVNAALTGGLAAAERASVIVKVGHTAITKAQTAAQTALNTAMTMNPYVMVTALVAGLTYAMYKLYKSTNETSKAQDRLDDANSAVEKSVAAETGKLDRLRERLSTTKKGSEEWEAAKNALIQQYGQYDSTLASEIDRTGTLTSRYDRLTGAIRRSIAARQLKSFYDSSLKEAEDSQQEYREKIYRRLREKYGAQTTRLVMDMVNQNASTGKGLDTVIRYSNDKKTWRKTTIRAMLKEAGGYDLISKAGKMRESQVAFDNSINEFADQNSISKKEMNEIIYGKVEEKKDEEGTKDEDKVNTPNTPKRTGTRSVDNQEEQQNEAAERAFENRIKTQVENQRRAKDIEMETDQAEIDILKDSSLKKRMQIELNRKKEQETIDRAYEDIKQHRIEEAKSLWEDDIKNKGKNFYDSEEYKFAASDDRYTEEEHMNYDAKTRRAWAVYEDGLKKIDKEEKDEEKKIRTEREAAINEFVKEYGTMQEQRLAIAKEYDAKIANESDQWRKKSLEKQKQQAIAAFDFKNFKEGINWDMVFGNLENYTKKALRATLKQIKEFRNSKEFSNLSVTDKKSFVEAEVRLRNAVSPNVFKDFRNSAAELRKAQDELWEAKSIKETVDSHRDVFSDGARKEAENRVMRAHDNLNQAQESAWESATRLEKALLGAGKAMSSLGKSSHQSIAEVGNSVVSILRGFNLIGQKAGGIISAVLEILDGIQKQGLTNFVSNIVGNVFGAVGSLFHDMGSVFGVDLFGMGSARKAMNNYKDTVNRYNNLNEIWDSLISKKREYLEMSWGKEAASTQEEIERLYEAEISGTQAQATALFGTRVKHHASSHTMGTWEDTFWSNGGDYKKHAPNNQSFWDRLTSELVGKGFSTDRSGNKLGISGVEDFFSLTKEELEYIKTQYAGLWATQNDSVRKLLDTYLGQLDTLEDSVQDSVDSVIGSVSDIADAIKGLATDVDKDFGDMSDLFNSSVNDEIWESLTNDKSDYYKRMKEYQKHWKQAEMDDFLSKAEVDALREEYASIYSDTKAAFDRKSAEMGTNDTNSSQSATANGVPSITYEQADNIVALTTAGNITREQIREIAVAKLTSIDVSANLANSVMRDGNNIADELRTIQANSYIELQGIHEDTTAMTKAIKSMSSDVSDIKKEIKDM